MNISEYQSKHIQLLGISYVYSGILPAGYKKSELGVHDIILMENPLDREIDIVINRDPKTLLRRDLGHIWGVPGPFFKTCLCSRTEKYFHQLGLYKPYSLYLYHVFLFFILLCTMGHKCPIFEINNPVL